MKALIFTALGALALSGCTGTHIKPPAVCDGKHRRPANMYGSILPSLPLPLPQSQGGGQSVATPAGHAGGAQAKDAPAKAAPALSSKARRDIALSYEPC